MKLFDHGMSKKRQLTLQLYYEGPSEDYVVSIVILVLANSSTCKSYLINSKASKLHCSSKLCGCHSRPIGTPSKRICLAFHGSHGRKRACCCFLFYFHYCCKKAIVKEFEEHMSMGELKIARGMYARNDGGYKLICCTYCSDFASPPALAREQQ